MRIARIYTCAQGDTWDSIALDVYGDETYAALLLKSNPGVTLGGGVEIEAPELGEESTGQSTDAPWRRQGT